MRMRAHWPWVNNVNVGMQDNKKKKVFALNTHRSRVVPGPASFALTERTGCELFDAVWSKAKTCETRRLVYGARCVRGTVMGDATTLNFHRSSWGLRHILQA